MNRTLYLFTPIICGSISLLSTKYKNYLDKKKHLPKILQDLKKSYEYINEYKMKQILYENQGLIIESQSEKNKIYQQEELIKHYSQFILSFS